MKYLARKLHLPGGEVETNHVVLTESGIVRSWQPFEAEAHSMMLVDELFISQTDNLTDLECMKACEVTDGRSASLLLYSISDGKLQKMQ